MTVFCRKCSEELLQVWKGWPGRNPIPDLPAVKDGRCVRCEENPAAEIQSDGIVWVNVHGIGSTRLPDHWELAIKNERISGLEDWGLPYYGKGKCPRCNCLSTLSEMNYPVGKELFLNCEECGISKLTKQIG